MNLSRLKDENLQLSVMENLEVWLSHFDELSVTKGFLTQCQSEPVED